MVIAFTSIKKSLSNQFSPSFDNGEKRKYVKIAAAGIWRVTHVLATHGHQDMGFEHAA